MKQVNLKSRIWNTSNMLLVIGLACQVICIVTLVKATRPSDEIVPVAPVLKKMFELPESRVRDVAIVTLKKEHDMLLAVNDVTRSLARLVSAIGVVVLVVAWRAHTEAKARNAGAPAS